MTPRIAFNRVHLPVPRRDDEVKRKMTGHATFLLRGGLLVRQPGEKVGSPFLAAFTDGVGSVVFVGHKHVVGGGGDEGGDFAIDDGRVGAPFYVGRRSAVAGHDKLSG